jgi:superfamily II DNA or RNA helicase
MKTDHWSKSVIHFLRPHLEQTTKSVQVATGFFTIQGYDLIREVLSGKWVQLMVGFDEHSRERLQEMLIDDIMRHLSRWDESNRRAAVLDLVKRIQAGRFQVVEHKEFDWVDARARNRDHAKIYILDGEKVLAGSVNLTMSGLKYNSENLTLVDELQRVDYYRNQFKTYWEADNTYDLTQALLEALLAWLELAIPFDVYLKSISVLITEDPLEAPRDTYKMPVNYQKVVIERLLRQLKEFQGAMLVASTGLGKTIMATHTALRLKRDFQIQNVVIFSPLQVQPDWKYAMRSAGLSYDVFTRDLLDRPGKRKGVKMRDMESALNEVDEKYLIIIDESQHFRNSTRAKDGKKRHSFNRLNPIVKEKKPHVLLLTATPYSKEVSDLNNQLLLLPHTAEKKFVETSGQFVMPGMKDEAIAPEAWKIIDKPDFFEDFMSLPVATVISTSQVAKDFATSTEEGEYIVFGEEKRWVPKVAITKVKVPVYLEEEVSGALRKGAFSHKAKAYKNRKQEFRYSNKLVQNLLEVAWMSSPKALEEVIAKTIANDYKVVFKRSAEKRKELLQPILDQIQKYDTRTDPKFQTLLFYLEAFKKENRKVIIFTERQSTAVYLEEALSRRLPLVKVGCTVKATDDGGTELKDFAKEVLPIIKGFAPRANADKIQPREKGKLVDYDILIATDAYSTGVNLQDASVVIHYDLAWTPDVLIQRAGRILRFWNLPRQVHFLIFVGDFKEDETGKVKTHNVEQRLRKLNTRGKEAEKFSEIPIIPKGDEAKYESLGDLSSVTIENLGLAEVSELEEYSGVSPFLRHITVLKEHEEYANQIPDDISSVMVYKGRRQLLYLLLRQGIEYHRVIYDLKSQTIESIKEDELLALIQCNKETPIANFPVDELEKQAQFVRKLWEAKYLTEENRKEKVERICALLLIPKGKESKFEEIIKPEA